MNSERLYDLFEKYVVNLTPNPMLSGAICGAIIVVVVYVITAALT